MLSHILLKVRPLLTFPFCNRSFTDTFHDRKGFLTVHPLINEIRHNIVTGTDCGRNGRLPASDQFLCIVKPYVSSVGEPGNTDQIGQTLWLRIYNHLNNKVSPKLRNTKATHRAASDILRLDTKCGRIMEQRHYPRIIQRNICRHKLMVCFIIFIFHRRRTDIFFQRLNHRRIIVSKNIQF